MHMKSPPWSVFETLKMENKHITFVWFCNNKCQYEQSFPKPYKVFCEGCDNFHDSHGADIRLLGRCHDSYFTLCWLHAVCLAWTAAYPYLQHVPMWKNRHTHTKYHSLAKTPTGTINAARRSRAFYGRMAWTTVDWNWQNKPKTCLDGCDCRSGTDSLKMKLLLVVHIQDCPVVPQMHLPWIVWPIFVQSTHVSTPPKSE